MGGGKGAGYLPLLHPVWWVLPLLHQEISFFIHSITFLHPEDGLRPLGGAGWGVTPWETVPNDINAEK
jgi:hypothetical protein